MAFSAMLMAGLDGIQKKIDPKQPLDKDIYSLTPEELKDVPSMPHSLEMALDNLKKDHEFLLAGNVFTEDVIETWIDYKMSKEVSEMRCGRIRTSSRCTTTPERVARTRDPIPDERGRGEMPRPLSRSCERRVVARPKGERTPCVPEVSC